MIPADERFNGEDGARPQVGLRLVVEHELAARHRRAQLFLQLKFFVDLNVELRPIELESVAADLLRPVHGGVGVGQQRVCVPTVVREGRGADAARHAQPPAVDLDRFGDRRLKLAHGRDDGFDILGLIAKDDDEFVAADAYDGIGRAQRGDHSRRDGLEQFVAGVVAQAVVDVFEIVEIDEGDRRPAVAPLRQLDRAREALLEQGAIGKPGQGVVGRHELDPVFRELALDGDAGDFGRGVDQPQLRRVRFANGARIERKRPQNLLLMRGDRRRPAGSKAVGGGERAKIGPSRVARHVGDDYRLADEGRGPARAGARADAQSVNRFDVGGGQVRRRAVMQAQACLVEQQDRGVHAVQLGFDEARQAIEDVGQRRARRDHFENLRLAVAQRLRQFARRDVPRYADHANDLAYLVAQRHLRRRHPEFPAVRVDDIFLDVDQGPAGVDDAPLVGQVFPGDVGAVKLEVRFSDQIAGRGETDLARRGVVGDDETARRVLDPEIVGHEVDQPLQRNAFRDDRAALVKLGYVVVRRNPAALRHRLELDLDAPSVRQAGGPGLELLVRADRIPQFDTLVDRPWAGSNCEQAFGDLPQRGAGLRLVRSEAVDFGEPTVAPDQSAFLVKEGNALPDVLDRRLVARRPGLEARDDRRLLADDDLLGLDHGAAQRDESRLVEGVDERRGVPVAQAKALSCVFGNRA